MQYPIKAVALAIITLSVLLPGSFSIPCQDDPGYTFGFTGNAPGERKTCEWLNTTILPGPERTAICNSQHRQNIIRNKCPETCDDDCNRPGNIPGCIDEVLRINGQIADWHDRTGTQYDCAYYKWGDNCFIFGGAFHNQEMAADDACCACGGGIRP